MRNKEVILTLIVIILFPIGIFSYLKWNDYKKERCRLQNGQAILDNFGFIEKCIVGDNK